MSIKYLNLHSFKEGLILLFQSILETRRITHLRGSAHFTIPLRNSLVNMSRSRDRSGHTSLLNKFSKQFPSFMKWTFLHSDIFMKIQAFIIDEKTTFTVWLNINLISFKAKTIIFLDFSMITSEILFDLMPVIILL